MRGVGVWMVAAAALLLAGHARADDDEWDLEELSATPTPLARAGIWDQPEPIKAKAPRREAARPAGRQIVGVGIVVGAPTGLSGKYRATPVTSVDAAFAMDDGVYYLHGDYLFEQKPFAQGSAATLGWFVGGGARAVLRENQGGGPSAVSMAAGNGNGNGNNGNGGSGGGGRIEGSEGSTNVHLGARVPVGVSARFTRAPRLELFGELALDVGVVGADGTDLSGSIGARWFF